MFVPKLVGRKRVRQLLVTFAYITICKLALRLSGDAREVNVTLEARVSRATCTGYGGTVAVAESLDTLLVRGDAV